MNKSITRTLATGILLMGIMGPGLVRAKTIEEEVSVTHGKNISAKEEGVISSAALKVLHHIAQARADIYEKDMKGAKAELKQSLTLVDIIKAALPTVTVKDHIWVAKKHLSYENTEEVIPDLVPIYASLDEIEDLVPSGKVKEHLDKARRNLKKGDKKGAKEELRLADEALLYTEIDLPLAYTEGHIIAAQGFLAANKPKKADEALKAAEDGVQFISIDVYSPITQAKKSLWKATQDFAAGKYDAAKQDLGEAKASLEKTTSHAGGAVEKESKKLLNDIGAIENDVAQGTKDAGQKLKNLYNRAKTLTQSKVQQFQSGDKH